MRHGYQTEMVGRRGHAGVGWRRDIMGAVEDAAAAGDAEAQEICRALATCKQPDWRRRQIAPGVQAPCEDLVPLPFRPPQDVANGTFVNAGPTEGVWTARTQKPFQGQRLSAIITRVGAGAANVVPVIRGGLVVGVDPQVAQIADMALEHFRPDAFGVRMQLYPAQPGVDQEIRIALVGPALAVGETINIQLALFGNIIQ